MKLPTTQGIPVDGESLCEYMQMLVGSFFKIIPIGESDDKSSLQTYLQSFQLELMGCQGLVLELKHEPLFISLISILQYFIDHPDISLVVLRRETFKAISICTKLKARYTTIAVGEEG